MIRKAEIRDLLVVAGIFKEVISCSQKLGTDLFSEDPNTLMTGVLESVILTINNPDAVILIDETEDGRITGLVAGELRVYPRFYKHPLVGEIINVYPAGFPAIKLFQAFDSWREEKGATITTGYIFPENDVWLRAVQKHGGRVVRHWIMGSFQEKRKCMTNSETTESSVA
jgi:hypothetical protein